MYLKIDDGVAIYATHFILTTIDRKDKGVRKNLAPFQLESDGIVVYPDQEILDIEWILRKLNIPYVITELQYDPFHITKTQGVKYASKTEAIKHLLHDEEPESQILPNLRQKLVEKDAVITALKAERDTEIQTLRNELKGIKDSLKVKGVI